MTLLSRISEMFVHDPIVDKNGKLVPNCINWFNQLTTQINSVLAYGRDSLGVGATNQKLIPFVQIPNMNTVTRDSVNGILNGTLIYNTDTNTLQVYASGVWVSL
jgi:hypothetical protein